MNLEKHILIIDDQPEIIELLIDILTPFGYKITAIAEAADIVKTVNQINPDLVIIDYILEGINGGEYCSQIKRNPDTQDIPVIILSGYPKVLSSLGDYGADVIIYKPFDADDFTQRVFELTSMHIARP